MRRIKFRGFHKGMRVFYMPEFNGEINKIFSEGEQRGIVYQQFTGLKDSRGSEVYEGDIFASLKYGTDTLSASGLRWEVFFDENHLQYYCRDKKEAMGCPLYEKIRGQVQYKVIGNIFENPELLEV